MLLQKLGVDTKELTLAMSLNDYATALQAAMEEQGITLGWSYIVQKPLETGQLMPAFTHTINTGKSFYLITPSSQNMTSNTKKVKHWMMEQARADRSSSLLQKVNPH